jgi:dTDP-4-dehydrorhamnose reductase
LKRKILITGANGLLGQKLVSSFLHQNEPEIVATGRGPARLDFGKLRYIDVDLSSGSEVIAAIRKEHPTHIIHSAAITQVDVCETDHEKCWLNNVIATENLLEAASELNAWFQYISTDFVFDGEGGPYRENDQPNPVNFYGRSKHAAEQIVQNSGLDCSIVRTVLVYGTGKGLSRGNIVLWVKNKLENGEAIRVVNDQWRTPTLVEDLALGCSLIVEKEALGIFHISGKDYVTPYEIALKTAGIFNLDKGLISPTNASEFVEEGKRPLKTGFDITKARQQLGMSPIPWRRV